MYKGKFDQKNKQETADVQELLAQRRQAQLQAKRQQAKPRAETPARPAPISTATTQRPASPDARPAAPAQRPAASGARPTAAKTAPSGAHPSAPSSRPASSGSRNPAPVQSKDAPVRRPAPAAEAPKRRGPRLGGVIFYTLYFMFILAFFAATYMGLQWLNGWLTDYQAAQPTVKAQQVFTQLFNNPQWNELYVAAGIQDSLYEGKEEFVTYMQGHVDPSSLTYLETSAGLSGDKKYEVRMGNEKIATFTLVDQNKVSGDTLADKGQIPDWELGAVELFFQRENTFRVIKVSGHTAMINGVALDDDHTIQLATTKAEKYLPDGTTGVSMCTQEVTGLFSTPEVTVFDDNGNPMDVTYDEATHTFTERTVNNTISEEEEQVVIETAQTVCKWMIEAITDRSKLTKYFDQDGDAYKAILSAKELWMQDYSGYEFRDIVVSDYAKYTDDLFSAHVSLTLSVTRRDGTVKDHPYSQSMFFHTVKGKWLCFKATNDDISQPVGKIRLTFMQGDTMLHSSFYYTDAEEIITPVISPIPEGKVFVGWVQKITDESGRSVLQLVFQPDDTGLVKIPEGTILEPMTLTAYFEDAPAQPAETTPQTNEGGE